MKLRSEDYRNDKERIDSYSYAVLDPIDALNICSDMLDDFTDDLTRTALAAGTLFYAWSILRGNTAED